MYCSLTVTYQHIFFGTSFLRLVRSLQLVLFSFFFFRESLSLLLKHVVPKGELSPVLWTLCVRVYCLSGP